MQRSVPEEARDGFRATGIWMMRRVTPAARACEHAPAASACHRACKHAMADGNQLYGLAGLLANSIWRIGEGRRRFVSWINMISFCRR